MQLTPGDRVPSTRQIVAEFGIAMATASKVLAALRQEGLVRVLPGVGTVVAGGVREPEPELGRSDIDFDQDEIFETGLKTMLDGLTA